MPGRSLAVTLVFAGLALLALGGLVWLGWLPGPLGRLPGDLRIERPGLTLYVPLTTCLLISALLSLVVWLVSRGP